MTATVKHISVHPKFRYARRVGIFDELDKRDAELKRKKNAIRQRNKTYGYAVHYVNKHNPEVEPFKSPFSPTPEN